MRRMFRRRRRRSSRNSKNYAPRRQRRGDADGRGRSGRPLLLQPPREGGQLRRLGARSHCYCCTDPPPRRRQVAPRRRRWWWWRRRHCHARVPGLCFITPPEATNTGPGLTGGPGAAPGGVTSKNGQGHMRVRVLGVPYSRRCLCVCVCVCVCPGKKKKKNFHTTI